MGLRFRRSWGVIPGVRFNLGLKSGSLSFGMRGLHYTVGTRGGRVTLGLPGTGLFWTQAHVFLPSWLVWSVFAVVIIAGLCFGAAMLAAVLR
jgi:hypothetical protein